MPSGAQRSTVYDSLNRETSTTVGNLSRNVSYLNVSGSRTTTLPSGVNYTQGGTALLNTAYTYDNNGNISTMTVDGVTYTYTYDSLNQLKTVSTSDNSYTASYNYDNGGNITSKTVNGTTTNYRLRRYQLERQADQLRRPEHYLPMQSATRFRTAE